jgi:ornithine carbamoyltransferase
MYLGLAQRDLVSIADLSSRDILAIVDHAQTLKGDGDDGLTLRGKNVE